MNITNEIKVFRSIRIFVLSVLVVLSFSSSYINQTEEEIQEERTEEIVEEFVIQSQQQHKKFQPEKESLNYIEFFDVDFWNHAPLVKPYVSLKLYIKYCQLALDKKTAEYPVVLNKILNPKNYSHESIRKNYVKSVCCIINLVRNTVFNSNIGILNGTIEKLSLNIKNNTIMKSIENIINDPAAIALAWFGSLFTLVLFLH